MAGLGPQPFPTGTEIIPTGQSVALVISGTPATLSQVINALNATSVGISIYNAATTGAANTANCVYGQGTGGQTLALGQLLTFDMYMSVGIVIEFATATTGNFTVTYTPRASY